MQDAIIIQLNQNVNELTARIAERQQAAQTLANENRELQRRLEAASKPGAQLGGAEELESLRNELSDLQSEYENLEQEKTQIEDGQAMQMEIFRKTSDELKKIIAKQEQELKSAQAELAKLKPSK